MGASFTELLPDTAAAKPQKRFVQWYSLHGLGVTAGGKAVAGVMEIIVVLSKNRNQTCRYIVSETATAWAGRAFHLKKAEGECGSDDEAEAYDCFIGVNPQDRKCECRGFLRHGHCKHLDSLLALLNHGKLSDESPVNPDLDTGPTEPADWGMQ
jgi:hypothetical protein